MVSCVSKFNVSNNFTMSSSKGFNSKTVGGVLLDERLNCTLCSVKALLGTKKYIAVLAVISCVFPDSCS